MLLGSRIWTEAQFSPSCATFTLYLSLSLSLMALSSACMQWLQEWLVEFLLGFHISVCLFDLLVLFSPSFFHTLHLTLSSFLPFMLVSTLRHLHTLAFYLCPFVSRVHPASFFFTWLGCCISSVFLSRLGCCSCSLSLFHSLSACTRNHG